MSKEERQERCNDERRRTMGMIRTIGMMGMIRMMERY
jgi:hypothetical protein